MLAAGRPRAGLMNGAGATRGFGINSPCCGKFERRILSLCHVLVGRGWHFPL
jgi:hypothetical protein